MDPVRCLPTIAYAGAVIVAAVAGGVFTGVIAERRREWTIEHLSGHSVICGSRRVGRRVSDGFRAAGVDDVVPDIREEAVHGDHRRGRNERRAEDLFADAG
jgi:voltage-gated potassium channel Kch